PDGAKEGPAAHDGAAREVLVRHRVCLLRIGRVRVSRIGPEGTPVPADRSSRTGPCYHPLTERNAMKICFFHLMPYRFLPEDFEQRYRSVWVDVPHSLYDPEKTSELYHEYLDELEFAERSGFDGLCVNEHHNNAYGLMPSPNLMAATLTRRTSRAAIIVLGNSLAAYNPPLRVAEELAMLDLMSRGRLVAGFPVG